MKKIAIIGFGVVGSGVYEIVRKNKEILTKKAGEEIDIKRILDIPVKYIGVGEQIGDMQPFDAKEYAAALLG